MEHQASLQKMNIENQQRFTKSIKENIFKDANMSDRDKKEVEKFYFDYKHPLEDGKRASDFYVEFMKMQNDPAEYVKFIKYVKNRDKFEEVKETKEKVMKSQFQLLRSGESITNKYTEIPVKKQTAQSKNPFDSYKF